MNFKYLVQTRLQSDKKITKIDDESFTIEYLILRVRYSPRRYPCVYNSPRIDRSVRPNTKVFSQRPAIRAQRVS